MWLTLQNSVFSRTFHLVSIQNLKGVKLLSVATAGNIVGEETRRERDGRTHKFFFAF